MENDHFADNDNFADNVNFAYNREFRDISSKALGK